MPNGTCTRDTSLRLSDAPCSDMLGDQATRERDELQQVLATVERDFADAEAKAAHEFRSVYDELKSMFSFNLSRGSSSVLSSPCFVDSNG